MDTWSSRARTLASCAVWLALAGCGGGGETVQPLDAGEALPGSYALRDSERALDLGVEGDGLFVLQPANGAARTYSRFGKLDLDGAGRLIHADGARVLGVSGDARATDPVPLPALPMFMAARASQRVVETINLDSRTPWVDADLAFDHDDAATFDSATGIDFRGADGSTHFLMLCFRHTAPDAAAGERDAYWIAWIVVDGRVANVQHRLHFSADQSQLREADRVLRLPAAEAGLPHELEIDFSGSTGYGVPFDATELSADGYGRGTLRAVEVDADGRIRLQYDNGQSAAGGQLVLARFTVADRLQRTGASSWLCGAGCRPPRLGTPGSPLMGTIRAHALNVSD